MLGLEGDDHLDLQACPWLLKSRNFLGKRSQPVTVPLPGVAFPLQSKP